MFRDEQATTTVDPEEVQRLAKRSERPLRTADGSGGLVPEEGLVQEVVELEDGDNWCAPTRTMDPLQQQELAARSTTTGRHDSLEIPQAPSTRYAIVEPQPFVPVRVPAPPKVVSAPAPYIRGATYVLLVLLVLLAAAAILARHVHFIVG